MSGGCERAVQIGPAEKAAAMRALSSVAPIESGKAAWIFSRTIGMPPRKQPA